MNSTLALTGSHLRTYQTIFQHPVSHNLGWHDVHALFRELGEVVEAPNGNLTVTRNGQTMVLQPARTKDVADTDQLMALRHFLERSETPVSAPNENDTCWLVVIDHREARVFRSTAPGAVPQQIRPHVPEDFFRRAPNSRDAALDQAKPDANRFFEPVAGVLNGAGKILVFGTGTGTSSEMDQFVAWLKIHRAALAARIIGTIVVDESHLTEDQLLAKARAFHAGNSSLHA